MAWKENPASVRRRVSWRRIAAFVATLSVLVVVGFVVVANSMAEKDAVDRLSWIKDRVRLQFPAAPQLSTDALSTRMASGEAFVVLDVREAEEYAVSHLPGAIRVDPGAPPGLPGGVRDDLPVVAYCSVGWRSSLWVEGLRSQGIDAVNLEGSIFQWAAEGRPLERAGEPVDVVHPYSRAWAWLVDPDRRAFSP